MNASSFKKKGWIMYTMLHYYLCLRSYYFVCTSKLCKLFCVNLFVLPFWPGVLGRRDFISQWDYIYIYIVQSVVTV